MELNTEHEGDPEFMKVFFQGYLNEEKLFFKNIQQYPVSRIQDLPNDKFKYYINNNYNITNQEGLFIMNVHPIMPLEEALIDHATKIGVKMKQPEHQVKEALNRHSKNFISYEIHKSLKEYILRKIRDKGINEKYIYPDLKNLADDCVKSYLMS